MTTNSGNKLCVCMNRKTHFTTSWWWRVLLVCALLRNRINMNSHSTMSMLISVKWISAVLVCKMLQLDTPWWINKINLYLMAQYYFEPDNNLAARKSGHLTLKSINRFSIPLIKSNIALVRLDDKIQWKHQSIPKYFRKTSFELRLWTFQVVYGSIKFTV